MKGEVKVSELRNKNDAELETRVSDLKRELYLSLCVGSGNENKGLSRKKAMSRKEIARIKTVLRERELDQILNEVLL